MINVQELLKLLETFHYRNIFDHSKISIKEWIGYYLWVSDLVNWNFFFFFNEWEIEFLSFIQQFSKLFFIFLMNVRLNFYFLHIHLCCVHKLFWFQLLGLKSFWHLPTLFIWSIEQIFGLCKGHIIVIDVFEFLFRPILSFGYFSVF